MCSARSLQPKRGRVDRGGGTNKEGDFVANRQTFKQTKVSQFSFQVRELIVELFQVWVIRHALPHCKSINVCLPTVSLFKCVEHIIYIITYTTSLAVCLLSFNSLRRGRASRDRETAKCFCHVFSVYSASIVRKFCSATKPR